MVVIIVWNGIFIFVFVKLKDVLFDEGNDLQRASRFFLLMSFSLFAFQ